MIHLEGVNKKFDCSDHFAVEDVSFTVAEGQLLVLLGGIGASGGLLQRVFDLPDATVNVLQGMLFLAILLSETFYGRRWFAARKAAA